MLVLRSALCLFHEPRLRGVFGGAPLAESWIVWTKIDYILSAKSPVEGFLVPMGVFVCWLREPHNSSRSNCPHPPQLAHQLGYRRELGTTCSGDAKFPISTDSFPSASALDRRSPCQQSRPYGNQPSCGSAGLWVGAGERGFPS